MTNLPKYLQREFERGGDKPRVLVEFGKYGNTYWNATGDRLFPVALAILRTRVTNGAIPSAKAAAKWRDEEATPELTEEQIKAIPEGKIRQAAETQRRNALSQWLEYDEMIRQANQVTQALTTEDGVLAWIILSNRSGNEYERVELQVLADPVQPEIGS